MLNLLNAVQHEHTLQEELFSVYVPTNHIYVGDIFLLGKEDIIHTSLSVREGLGEHAMPNPGHSAENIIAYFLRHPLGCPCT